MKISLVAAMDRNRLIGKSGAKFGLPWDLPDDRIFFRQVTLGKPVIEGRKTYEATGRLLPDRPTIIVTHDQDFHVTGATVVHSTDEALNIAREKAEELQTDEIMVIGGGQIFTEFLPRADRIYLTLVNGVFEGEAYFPEFDESDWREVNRDHHSKDERHVYSFDIVTFDRVRGSNVAM